MSTQPLAHIHNYSALNLRSTRHYMILWWLLAAILVPNIGLLFRPMFGLYGWVFYGLVFQSTLFIPLLILMGTIFWIFPPSYRHLWPELRIPFCFFWTMILLEIWLPTDTVDDTHQYFPLVAWLTRHNVPNAWATCATIVGTLALISYGYILARAIHARRNHNPHAEPHPRPVRSARHTMVLAWISTAVVGFYGIALTHIRIRAWLGAELGFTLVLPPMGIAIVPTLSLLGMVLLAFPKTTPNLWHRIRIPYCIFWAMAFTIVWFAGDYFTDWWRIPTLMTIVSHTGRNIVRPLALAIASPLLLIALINLGIIFTLGIRSRRAARRASTETDTTETSTTETGTNTAEAAHKATQPKRKANQATNHRANRNPPQARQRRKARPQQPTTNQTSTKHPTTKQAATNQAAAQQNAPQKATCAGLSATPASSAPAGSSAGTKRTTRPKRRR
ncbi:MAG: hypothetical protein Q4A82_02245 [Corynebacterium sp.]|nr:hypothetical protein [Corynebacterium sp.]